MNNRIILDLCGGTGSWSQPYVDAGYNVRVVTLPIDIRTTKPPAKVHGVLAAPPCCHLAGCGAKWWKIKGENALLESLSIVDACFRFICLTNPVWWVLENPVGRLVNYIGKPTMYFHPYEYGDPYTKKTCLWGKFNIPTKNVVEPYEGSKMWKLPPSTQRKELRSITPAGFAKAFFKANP